MMGEHDVAHERAPRSITLRDAWEELRRVRTSIEEYFSKEPEDFRVAATMAATELTENVLKHASDPGSGLVTMAERDGEVVISTQNRVASQERARELRDYIREISARGAREMYVARMLEIMNEPNAHRSGLGLVRIAYEGAFQLSSEVLGDRLLIRATRRIVEQVEPSGKINEGVP